MRIEFENGSVIETVESNDDNVIRGKGIGFWQQLEEDEEESATMTISDGYLVTLEDNSFTNLTHVLVTSRYYEKYKHMEEFKTATEIVKCLDLRDEMDKQFWLEVWS